MKAETSRIVNEFAGQTTRWVGSMQSVIVHTILFGGSFLLAYFGVLSFDRMLLVLTTIVSLEAIYLAIFIQMSLNRASEAIAAVEQDIDEIQEDVDEIQKDVDEIQEDVEELNEEDGVVPVSAPVTLEEVHEKLLALINDVEKIQHPRT